MGVKNFLRSGSISLLTASKIDRSHIPLSYPMKPLQVGDDECMVYEIPAEDMQDVLNKVQPRHNKKADDLMFDTFNGKTFLWKEAMVLWYKNTNLLVSPYFVESGSDFLEIIKWHPGVAASQCPKIVK